MSPMFYKVYRYKVIYAILSLFFGHILFFSFYINFLAFHPALRLPKNRKRKQRSENEDKKRKLHELLYSTQKLLNQGLLDSPLDWSSFHNIFINKLTMKSKQMVPGSIKKPNIET